MELGRHAHGAAADALAAIISPLPHYRGQPSALIATIVTALARQMNLPDHEIDKIRVAALLHDVGKVGIPADILEKPSSLSPAEWRSVVQHPRIGQVILEQATMLRDSVPIILHHHERFGGAGYPYGLSGHEIPLGARIVAIADAYDAMIQDRPYKRKISHDAAVGELRGHAGTQFDPELVDIFCDLYAAQAPEADPAALVFIAAAQAHPHAPPASRRRAAEPRVAASEG
jgi:HD-GYP domain-containing protein (c-di-GMP phosphodiesterase class II)